MTVATNIRLSEDLLKTLKHKAVEEKKSLNKLICEAIEASLTTLPVAAQLRDDPFEAVIGAAKSGCRDGSVNHDHYLYGAKK
jgi:hypothetical protein